MKLQFDAHYSSRDPSKARTITYHLDPPTIQTILLLLTVGIFIKGLAQLDIDRGLITNELLRTSSYILSKDGKGVTAGYADLGVI